MPAFLSFTHAGIGYHIDTAPPHQKLTLMHRTNGRSPQSMNGTFQVLSWSDGGGIEGVTGTEGRGGVFVGVLYREFQHAIYGGKPCVIGWEGGG